mgnify:FL=1
MSHDIWLTVRNVCNAFPYNNIHLVLQISHFVFHLSYSHTVFVNMGNTSENYQNMLNIIFVNGLKNNWSLPKLCLKIWPYFDKLQSNYLCYRIVSNADYNQLRMLPYLLFFVHMCRTWVLLLYQRHDKYRLLRILRMALLWQRLQSTIVIILLQNTLYTPS